MPFVYSAGAYGAGAYGVGTMTVVGNPNANNVTGVQGYDDTNHQVVNIRAKNISTDSIVTPNVTVGDLGVDVEVSVNPPADSSATGTVTLDQDAVSLTLGSGQDTATIQVLTANLSGTLLFEGSPDSGTTWDSLLATPVGGGTRVSTSVGTGGAQAVGRWRTNVGGLTTVRVRLHPTTSGTATINLRASTATSEVTEANSNSINSNLVSLVTNTADLLADGDFLTTIATNTTNLNTIEGTTADAAVVGDNTGTISSKLRGLTKIFNDIWDSTNHLFAINVKQIGGIAAQMAGSDGLTSTNVPERAIGVYNGTTTDQMRGNVDNVTVLASASRTTTQTPADLTNYNARGVIVCVDTTVLPGSAVSNVVTINAKDPVSGKYNTLLTGAAIVGVSTNFYTVYPGATVAANVTVSYPLPRTFQVKITAGNSNACTYSVGASYIL